ncbi:MAG: isoprenylcysteine carboxylmethyltransferase family protein [Candidatus Atribacteria bacterium]|nr:isoprenylcysteine carboxylmethyltransferase family protein [Candidatus Atribacteria bacterium]
MLLGKNQNLHQIVDRRSKFVVMVCIGSGVILAILPRDFRLIWQSRATFGPAQHVGVALMIAGVSLRLISILTLGKHFTPDITLVKNHKLVRKGVYRLIRHPNYTGEFFAFGGTALVFWHVPSSLFIFVPPFLGFLYRAFLEEQKLLAIFGEEYREYMRKTRRFI